mmetsp:Transcript_32419/g.70531  ORF Transcript_32419/g.70531 Transcript_32419/m.70531 type:complete len:230 (-) Transcript_32419:65-754(-)
MRSPANPAAAFVGPSWAARPPAAAAALARPQALARGTEDLAQATGGLAAATVAAAVGLAAASGRRPARRSSASRGPTCCSATATQKITKVNVDTTTKSKTQRDMWAVMVHAPIRNCRMPMCKIPGLRKIICTCLKDGITPPTNGGAAIRSKDGKCALTVTEYAEVLSDGVPVLSRSKAYEVASRLFESAMQNDVGTTVVISTFKKGALEYEKKLLDLGLWVSIASVDQD